MRPTSAPLHGYRAKEALELVLTAAPDAGRIDLLAVLTDEHVRPLFVGESAAPAIEGLHEPA